MNEQHDQGAPQRSRTAPALSVLDEEALDWALRLREPDADWDAFIGWLEADATRADRYDQAASALLDAEHAVAELPATRQPTAAIEAVLSPYRRRGSSRGWIGGAVAAAVVAAVGIGAWWEVPRPYHVETAAGERRAITLADGGTVLLAGASKVRLDRVNPRVAVVEQGEVLFRIRHNGAAPFTVQAGDLRLVDIGTVFDVKIAAGRTRVAVAEGAVMVDPDGTPIRLGRGHAIVADRTSLRRLAVDPSDVGGWREGRLGYDDATLEEVAADLSRELGRSIRATPAVSRRTFRGTLDTRVLADRPALLAHLLGVSVRTSAQGWILEPPS